MALEAIVDVEGGEGVGRDDGAAGFTRSGLVHTPLLLLGTLGGGGVGPGICCSGGGDGEETGSSLGGGEGGGGGGGNGLGVVRGSGLGGRR